MQLHHGEKAMDFTCKEDEEGSAESSSQSVTAGQS